MGRSCKLQGERLPRKKMKASHARAKASGRREVGVMMIVGWGRGYVAKREIGTEP